MCVAFVARRIVYGVNIALLMFLLLLFVCALKLLYLTSFGHMARSRYIQPLFFLFFFGNSTFNINIYIMLGTNEAYVLGIALLLLGLHRKFLFC